MKKLLLFLPFLLLTGCASPNRNDGLRLQNDGPEGAQIRAGIDFANLPKEQGEGFFISAVKAPFRLLSDGAAAYGEQFEKRPWTTTLLTVAGGLAIGEVTGGYGFTDLFDTTFSVKRDKGEAALGPDKIEASNGATVVIRDAPSEAFNRHSFRATGPGSQVILDFNASGGFEE
jgi:hypothetical protein